MCTYIYMHSLLQLILWVHVAERERERESWLTKTRGQPLAVSGVWRLRVAQLLSDVTVGGAGGGATGLVTVTGPQTVPPTISWSANTTERENELVIKAGAFNNVRRKWSLQ